MVLQASFADPAPKRVKDWSPIDRMLANKRGSGSKRNSPTTMTKLSSEAPPPSQQPAPPTRTVSSASQTTEVVPPERMQVQALQAELKALRAQMKRQEEAAKAREADAASHVGAGEVLASELEALRQLLHDTKAAHTRREDAWVEERQSWEKERARLKEEVTLAGSSERRGAQDLEHLRAELKRSQDDALAARKKCSKLQQDLDSLSREKDSLKVEKDGLLERLEVEQAEMIERVDALQRKMSERPCKVK